MRAWMTTLLLAAICVSAISASSPVSAGGNQASSNLGGLDSCLVNLTGDVNYDARITAADIIYTVNFVFLRGLPPVPCTGAGDINCNGTVTTADVIGLVNYIFKSGQAPCDICESESGQIWGCII